MKRYVNYLVDSFVDFKNVEHHFVICSLSETMPKTVHELGKTDYEDGPLNSIVVSYSDMCDFDWDGELVKSLSIGIAICNPEDDFNETIGKAKALGKAENSMPVLFATKSGVINTTMVSALMQQEANYLKSNPELYIKGYADAKKKYEQHQKDLDDLANLTEEELQAYEYLMTSSDESLSKVIRLVNSNV